MNVHIIERRSADRGAELRLSVPADPNQSLYVRRQIIGFAAAHGIGGDDVIDFIAAIGEALANAIEHAQTCEAIDVAMWMLGEDRLFASVTDRGIGFLPNDQAHEAVLPDAFSERGRGLPIMRSCSDVFTVRSAPGQGTHVMLGCFVQRASSAEALEQTG